MFNNEKIEMLEKKVELLEKENRKLYGYDYGAPMRELYSFIYHDKAYRLDSIEREIGKIKLFIDQQGYSLVKIPEKTKWVKGRKK
jgi:hypothetical protein